MADSDVLRNYKPQDYPQLPGSQDRYVVAELRRIAEAIAQINSVVKKIDARLTAHGW
jgi:hypothetical protein